MFGNKKSNDRVLINMAEKQQRYEALVHVYIKNSIASLTGYVTIRLLLMT